LIPKLSGFDITFSKTTFSEKNSPEEREYPDAADQIREVLIHENYLLQEDIDICLGFDLPASRIG